MYMIPQRIAHVFYCAFLGQRERKGEKEKAKRRKKERKRGRERDRVGRERSVPFAVDSTAVSG